LATRDAASLAARRASTGLTATTKRALPAARRISSRPATTCDHGEHQTQYQSQPCHNLKATMISGATMSLRRGRALLSGLAPNHLTARRSTHSASG
jgi:L-asparaginase/Glu-tRNA(Gln) amidotransferase subunit D